MTIKALKQATATLPLVIAFGLFAVPTAHANPVALSDAQMDSVVAAGVDMVDGFVCPVITTENVLNSPKGGNLGIAGFYTIGGPDVTVPVHATNDDGNGIPIGPFAQPGDTSYTAIWGTR